MIPALAIRGATDEASWPGVAPATTWEFPVATSGPQFAPSVMLTNSGIEPVSAIIDAYTADGSSIGAREVEVDPSIPRRVDLGDLVAGSLAIRVRSSGPVAAVVLAEESKIVLEPTDEEGEIEETAEGDRIAGTIGVSSPAQEWLLPGLQGVAAGESTVWLLNTGAEPATVTLQPLGTGNLAASKQTVPAGSVLGVPLGHDDAVGGYQIESSTPISVAWSVEAESGVMFVTGTVVGG